MAVGVPHDCTCNAIFGAVQDSSPRERITSRDQAAGKHDRVEGAGRQALGRLPARNLVSHAEPRNEGVGSGDGLRLGVRAACLPPHSRCPQAGPTPLSRRPRGR